MSCVVALIGLRSIKRRLGQHPFVTPCGNLKKKSKVPFECANAVFQHVRLTFLRIQSAKSLIVVG